MIIGNKCVAFWAFDKEGNLRAIPCKKWSCKVCQKLNAKLWAWRAQLQVDGTDKTYYMWTLTLGSNYKDVSKAYSDLKKLWDRLRKSLQRYYAKESGTKNYKWTYLAFVEGQPKRNGMPHFHIISGVIAPERIKDFAVHNGFGFEAYEKKITGRGAANYVAKYASKGAGIIPRSFRRVRASRDWHKLPDYEKDKLLVKGNAETLTEYLLRVSAVSGISPDQLLTKWYNAREVD